MDVGFNERFMTVIVDLRNWSFTLYNRATCEDVHKKFGGAMHFCIDTAGKGYIPDSACLMRVNSFQADRFPMRMSPIPTSNIPAAQIMGQAVYVPLTQQSLIKQEVATSAPSVVVRDPFSKTAVTIFPWRRVEDILSEEVDPQIVTNETMEFEVISAPGQKSHLVFKVETVDYPTVVEILKPHPVKQFIRRFLISAYYKHFKFHWPEGLDAKSPNWPLFWSNLGLYSIQGKLHKVVKGICWRAISENTGLTDPEFEELIPKNVTVLTDSSYIQKGENGFFLCSRQDDEREELTPKEYLRHLTKVPGLKSR